MPRGEVVVGSLNSSAICHIIFNRGQLKDIGYSQGVLVGIEVEQIF